VDQDARALSGGDVDNVLASTYMQEMLLNTARQYLEIE
jgi:hypothetical protein